MSVDAYDPPNVRAIETGSGGYYFADASYGAHNTWRLGSGVFAGASSRFAGSGRGTLVQNTTASTRAGHIGYRWGSVPAAPGNSFTGKIAFGAVWSVAFSQAQKDAVFDLVCSTVCADLAVLP